MRDIRYTVYCPQCTGKLVCVISPGVPSTWDSPGEPAYLDSITGACPHAEGYNRLLWELGEREFERHPEGGAIIEQALEVEHAWREESYRHECP